MQPSRNGYVVLAIAMEVAHNEQEEHLRRHVTDEPHMYTVATQVANQTLRLVCLHWSMISDCKAQYTVQKPA